MAAFMLESINFNVWDVEVDWCKIGTHKSGWQRWKKKNKKKKQVILKKDKTLTLPSYFWRNWA